MFTVSGRFGVALVAAVAVVASAMPSAFAAQPATAQAVPVKIQASASLKAGTSVIHTTQSNVIHHFP